MTPKVVGLVYLAAYGPDSGESLSAVSANAPQTELTKYLVPSGGYVFISEEGVKTVFANELSPKQQALVYATQTPASHTIFDDKSGEPAWKHKPTWYVVAKNDKTDTSRFGAFYGEKNECQNHRVSVVPRDDDLASRRGVKGN
jgi:hypothetical protein